MSDLWALLGIVFLGGFATGALAIIITMPGDRP